MNEIASVSSIGQFHEDDGVFSGFPEKGRSLLDSKVQEIVLTQIRIKSSAGTLFATAALPCIVDLIPTIVMSPEERKKDEKLLTGEKGRRRRQNLYPIARGKHLPIGLSACEPFLPLNAMMQFILFFPGLREIFSLAPPSFQSMVDFIEQYLFDQEKNHSISSADSNRLIQLLFHKLPSYFFRKFLEIDFAEFLFGLSQAAFGKNGAGVSDSIAFHPEWHAKWDPMFPFSCAVDLPSRPPELLVSIKNRQQLPTCPLIQRQFFTKPDLCCYDLDAFIEYQEGHFAAYLKSADGIWYRCLDLDIVAIRSTHLKMPLARSVFLHYTRIWPL